MLPATYLFYMFRYRATVFVYTLCKYGAIDGKGRISERAGSSRVAGKLHFASFHTLNMEHVCTAATIAAAAAVTTQNGLD